MCSGLLTLDVGCGNYPRGVVNVDRYKEWNPEIEQVREVDIDIRNIPNFILADALYLPFRDRVFKKVFSV